MGGGVHRDTETLTLSVAQTHTANVMGVRPPGFCLREVWQDFIRVVVLCLLRRRLHELFHPGMSFTPG